MFKSHLILVRSLETSVMRIWKIVSVGKMTDNSYAVAKHKSHPHFFWTNHSECFLFVAKQHLCKWLCQKKAKPLTQSIQFDCSQSCCLPNIVWGNNGQLQWISSLRPNLLGNPGYCLLPLGAGVPMSWHKALFSYIQSKSIACWNCWGCLFGGGEFLSISPKAVVLPPLRWPFNCWPPPQN